MRTARALRREMIQKCFMMKERRWKQKLGRGWDLCIHLLFTPAGAESMQPLSCSLATFLSEARGASLDNASELWMGLSQGASKGRAVGLARRD